MIKPNIPVGSVKVMIIFLIVMRNFCPQSTLSKEHKICFNCLSNDHILNKCKFKVSCRIDVSKKRHHTLLHNSKYIIEQENEGNNQNSYMHNHSCFENKFNLLQIIPVILSNNTNNIKKHSFR